MLSGGYPAFDTWIPSHQEWTLKGVPVNTPDRTPFHSKVVGGSINQIVDRDLQTSLALDLANPPSWAPAPGWVTFDLGYSFTISAFKVHTVWTNGPRRTTLEYVHDAEELGRDACLCSTPHAMYTEYRNVP